MTTEVAFDYEDFEEDIAERAKRELDGIYKYPLMPEDLLIPEAINWEMAEKLRKKNCTYESITSLLSVEHGFIVQLLDDDLLKKTFCTLLSTSGSSVNFDKFEPGVRCAAKTIARALDNRVEYMYALSVFVSELYPHENILSRRAQLAKDTGEEIDYLVQFIGRLGRFEEFETHNKAIRKINREFTHSILHYNNAAIEEMSLKKKEPATASDGAH